MHQRQNRFATWAGILCGAFFAAALAVDAWPSDSRLPWVGFNEAQTRARSSNKPVFLDVYAEWCAPCKEMDRSVFPDDSVTDVLSKKYELARVNLDDPIWGDSLRKRFQLRAIPTYIVLTPGGREVKRHVGYFEKSSFIQWLQDSTHLLVFSWRRFEEAKAQAAFQEKRLLVVITASSENYEKLSSLFDKPGIHEIIDSVFIPTVLLRSNSSDAEMISRLGASNTQNTEMFVLEGDKQIGRFLITPEMQFNQSKFLQKLYEFSGGLPGTRRRSSSQKRISLSSSQ